MYFCSAVKNFCFWCSSQTQSRALSRSPEKSLYICEWNVIILYFSKTTGCHSGIYAFWNRPCTWETILISKFLKKKLNIKNIFRSQMPSYNSYSYNNLWPSSTGNIYINAIFLEKLSVFYIVLNFNTFKA